MPREWTAEQRREASERAKARGLGRTAVAERSPEMFLAQNEGRMEESIEMARGDVAVRTTHRRPTTTVMYKPMQHGGYSPRLVSVNSIRQNLQNGWAEHCPDCGKDHIDKNGEHSMNPNLCSDRPMVMSILCPVCRLQIYDNMHFDEMAHDEDDPSVVVLDDLLESTPEQRLQAARNLHLWVTHPRAAQERGIPPLPEAMRDLMRPV